MLRSRKINNVQTFSQSDRDGWNLWREFRFAFMAICPKFTKISEAHKFQIKDDKKFNEKRILKMSIDT